MGTAKHEQKEHLRRSIKKAREAADLADQEMAALQRDQATLPTATPDVSTPSEPVPSSNTSPPLNRSLSSRPRTTSTP